MNRLTTRCAAGEILLLAFVLLGCGGGRPLSEREMLRESPREYTVGATLWYQKSAEARALYYQAYTLARHLLDHALRSGTRSRPAVILDIDETVLDNSPYQAHLIKTRESYTPSSWKKWTARSDADLLPGVVEFLTHADSLEVAIFFVTNRDADEADATLRNLRRKGVPQATMDHLLPRTGISSKEPRRKEIANGHEVILLIGDNLSDFSEVFEKKSADERLGLVDSLRSSFAERFVMVPNPMYGDWEGALYGYEWSLPDSVRAIMRMRQLVGY